MRCSQLFRATLVCALGLGGCVAWPDPPPADPHLIYLHGKIVEDQGPAGVSERFGRYDYPAILAALRARGFAVIGEVRPKGTDPSAYADTVVAQVRALIADGVDPSHITVVGASKGGVIAALVSDRLNNRDLRYVLLAPCNDWLVKTHDPHLTGRVLSVYEASDELGRSCEAVRQRSPGLAEYREIRLETGLGHGIVYQPLGQWIDPLTEWARR